MPRKKTRKKQERTRKKKVHTGVLFYLFSGFGFMYSNCFVSRFVTWNPRQYHSLRSASFQSDLGDFVLAKIRMVRGER